MSFGLVLGISFLRAAAVAAAAIPVCCLLVRLLQSRSKRRWLVWLLLILPVVAPRMLTGFGYANFSFSLVAYSVWNELQYGLLLLMAVVPVGTVLRYFAPPPPIGKEAMHCLRLGTSLHAASSSAEQVPAVTRPFRSGLLGLDSFFRGTASQYLASFTLMFLLAFQEFELASLMGVTSWTVWLFDAQAGGLILTESLRYAMWPVLCETVVLGGMGYLVWRNRGIVRKPQPAIFPMAKTAKLAGWSYLAVALLIYCLIPWTFIGRAALGGMAQLRGNFAIGRDIFAGSVFACLATCAAYGLAGSFVIQAKNRHIKVLRALVMAMGLPGLLGSLVLGLSVLFVFQQPLLQSFYGTALPWLAGSFLFLLPRALLVVWIFVALRDPEARHVTQLLTTSPRARDRVQARELQWRLVGWPHYLAIALLFFWSYSDLTIAAILAPSGIITAPVRLYNLMHYGQSAVLCATVVAAFGLPTLFFGMGLLFRRPLQKVLVP